MTDPNTRLSVDDTCPHCFKCGLKYITADYPYSEEHLQCPYCDSTYPFWEINGAPATFCKNGFIYVRTSKHTY